MRRGGGEEWREENRPVARLGGEGSALIVTEADSSIGGNESEVQRLDDGESRNDERSESKVGNELRVLVVVDSEQGPREDNGSGEITTLGAEGVTDSSGSEEGEGDDGNYLGYDRVVVAVSSVGEGGETGDEDGNEGPGVPEGEGEVDKEGVQSSLGGVVSRERVVDGRHGREDKEGEDEGDDVVSGDPDVYEDGVQNRDEGESPPDTVNSIVRGVDELVDDLLRGRWGVSVSRCGARGGPQHPNASCGAVYM